MMNFTAAELSDLQAQFGHTATTSQLYSLDPKILRRAKAGGLRKIGWGRWEIVASQMPAAPVFDPESEKAKIGERFEVLETLADALVAGNVRSVICSGAPGVGKTYTLEKRLRRAKGAGEINNVEFVKGSISPIGLFLKLWENNNEGDVLVLDDIDSVFNDEEAMNLLKAALDTSRRRNISWVKDSNFLRDREIPESFEYQGQIVFLTNVDLDAVNQKGGRMAAHMGALLSRACYLDLGIHKPEQVLLRIEQVLETTGMARNNDLKASDVAEILGFMRANMNSLRSISLRTVIQIAGFMKTTPDWQKIARATLLVNR